MYRVIRVVAFQGIKRYPYGNQSKHGTITQFCFNVGPALKKLTSIEPAMGCDAGPKLNRYWVGRPTLCVPDTLYILGGGRNMPTR